MNGGPGDPSVCTFFGIPIGSALQNEVPAEVLATAKGRQRIWDVSGAPLSDCTVGFDESGMPVPQCKEAAKIVQGYAEFGLKTLYNFNPPAALLNAVVKAAHDGEINANGTGNWECVNVPDLPSTCNPHARCTFLLRAKSLVVNPDSVDLRWFDDINDQKQPGVSLAGVVAFLMAYDGGGGAGRVCNRPSPSEGFLRRYFATTHQGSFTCKDPQSLRFRDDCCVADADCPVLSLSFDKPKCDLTKFRCAGAGCGNDLDCYAFEHCVKGACVPFKAASCEPGDPFGPACPAGAVCEGGECRQR